MELFKSWKSKKCPMEGVIDRIGPWHGPADVTGIAFTLENIPTVFRILRDDQSCKYPAGLSRTGDKVMFEADEDGSVSLSSFRNLTLSQ